MAGLAVAALSVALSVSASAANSTTAGLLSAGASTSTSTVAKLARARACGTVPAALPADPDGVLKHLPRAVQLSYIGDAPVYKSIWSHFKPNHRKPWKIGWETQTVDTPYIAALNSELIKKAAQYKREGLISQFLVRTSTSSQASPQAEIQAIRSLIQAKVNLILVTPLSIQSIEGVAKEAAAANIPIVMPLNDSPSAGLVGVEYNEFLGSADPMAHVMQHIGGKGNVLMVEGIPGVAGNHSAKSGAEAAIKACPNVSVIGDVVGDFSPAAAKGATLQFLSTHPAGADAVFQAGAMAGGVIGAFQQFGKRVPPMNVTAPVLGELVAWRDDRKLDFTGAAFPPRQQADVSLDVGLRMLAGDGLKINQVTAKPPMITRANLAHFIPKGASTSSVVPVEGPKGPMTDRYLNGFFRKPGPAS